eukprot:353408-Chlamydomonas_euryale.AAC.11
MCPEAQPAGTPTEAFRECVQNTLLERVLRNACRTCAKAAHSEMLNSSLECVGAVFPDQRKPSIKASEGSSLQRTGHVPLNPAGAL